jgi:hypothetical protein
MDETRCQAEVWETRWPRPYQCQRKAVVDGKWCKQHDPAAIEARKKAADARSDAEWQKRRIEIHGKCFYETLKQIAEGHNDPRALAQEMLDQFDGKPTPPKEAS